MKEILKLMANTILQDTLENEASGLDVAGTLKSRFCILFLLTDSLFRILYIFLLASSARLH